jgi:flavin-dependent dehydrogenase
VDRLKRDIENRPEYQGANVAEMFDKEDKLGAAIALRRPLDSMVAPGYLAAGGAAGTTHPITGKGIRGAAFSGYSAGRAAAEAVADGDLTEHGLWEHNRWLYREHGEAAMLASRDAYNVAGSTIEVNILRAVAALLPEDEIRDIVGTETNVSDLKSKLLVGAGVLKNLVSEYRAGTFETLGVTPEELYESIMGVVETRNFVREYEDIYTSYPADRDTFENWLSERNRIDEAFYDTLELSASERKY